MSLEPAASDVAGSLTTPVIGISCTMWTFTRSPGMRNHRRAMLPPHKCRISINMSVLLLFVTRVYIPKKLWMCRFFQSNVNITRVYAQFISRHIFVGMTWDCRLHVLVFCSWIAEAPKANILLTWTLRLHKSNMPDNCRTQKDDGCYSERERTCLVLIMKRLKEMFSWYAKSQWHMYYLRFCKMFLNTVVLEWSVGIAGLCPWPMNGVSWSIRHNCIYGHIALPE